MTSYQAALPSMRTQISAQITGNGAPCDVLRFSSTKDASGRQVGSYASILSGTPETIWIQPYSIAKGGSAMTNSQGILGETTHIGFQTHAGVALIPKDRINQSGETFAFDVIDQQNFDTHNELFLKQVRRS